MYLKAFEYFPIFISYRDLLEGLNVQSLRERYRVTFLLFLHDLLTGKISNCRLIAAVKLRVPRRGSRSNETFWIEPSRTNTTELSVLRRAAKLYHIIIVKDPEIDIFSMGL